MDSKINIIECPRDAMQGLGKIISTEDKVKLISNLQKVGFPTIDFGSFVSPKAIPQMADTTAVLEELEMGISNSALLAIVANQRGAEEAVKQDKVAVLGYPLSVSETFQKRNSNKTIIESLEELVQLVELVKTRDKELVVYLSMAFGNPYGDPYSLAMVEQFAGVLISLGISTISISDTVGLATPNEVGELYKRLSTLDNSVEWGLHLHARPEDAAEKLRSAFTAGCRRLDGAILGFGGCPMAEDDLVGNLNTKTIIEEAESFGLDHGLNLEQFELCEQIAQDIFNTP